MAIQIQLLQENETTLANNFFNSIYQTNRSIENFRWEFLEGPWGRAIYIVAVDDSVESAKKIVGIQCAIPMELVDSSGGAMLTAKSEDTLVDPAYRGQKIFERMYDLLFSECRKAGIKYIWGFTPAKKAFERIGFEIPFQAHQALMVFNPKKSYGHLSTLNPKNNFADKMKIAGLSVLSWVASSKVKFQLATKVIAKKIPIHSKTEILNQLKPSSSLYFLHMTEAYMTWRLTKNPFHNNYENYQFFHDGLLIADAIINYRQPGLGYIEQIIFSEKISRPLKESTLVQLIKLMRKKASLVRVLCFDTNHELKTQGEILKQCGFIMLNRGGYFVWKNLEQGKSQPENLFISRLFTQGNQ